MIFPLHFGSFCQTNLVDLGSRIDCKPSSMVECWAGNVVVHDTERLLKAARDLLSWSELVAAPLPGEKLVVRTAAGRVWGATAGDSRWKTRCLVSTSAVFMEVGSLQLQPFHDKFGKFYTWLLGSKIFSRFNMFTALTFEAEAPSFLIRAQSTHRLRSNFMGLEIWEWVIYNFQTNQNALWSLVQVSLNAMSNNKLAQLSYFPLKDGHFLM